MARPVENADSDLRNLDALGFRQRLDVVGGFCIEIDKSFGITATDGDLVHIGIRRMKQAATLGHGQHRRSEEHTSELQSLMRISYAVFCLKKKNNSQHDNINIQTPK